jgi:hypothetical protein
MSIAGDLNVPPPSREEVREFMRRYDRGQRDRNVDDELAYYAPRVDYFAHGIVPKTYVRSELLRYHETWPQRKYAMDEEVTLTKRGDNTAATAIVAYQLANPVQTQGRRKSEAHHRAGAAGGLEFRDRGCAGRTGARQEQRRTRSAARPRRQSGAQRSGRTTGA